MNIFSRDDALSYINSHKQYGNFKILICGSVNSGKSTFGKDLINCLLKDNKCIAWLDCDIGQPEFTPPSVVSFHFITENIYGSSVDHLRSPILQYFVGSISPKTEISYYIECIFALIDYYNTNIQINQCIPLIINTNGWIKGNGGRILSTIIQKSQPNIIVQLLKESNIQTNRDLINYNDFVSNTKILTLKSYSIDNDTINNNTNINSNTSNTKISAKQMRDMLLLRYFKCDKIPLSCQIPYSIRWNKLCIRFLFDEILCSMSMLALNCSIVGLCYDSTKYKNVGSKIQEHNDYPSYLLSTPICECIGLGIIRAIDPNEKLFYILTPLSLKQLTKVNTIMKGNIEIPTLSLIEGGVMNAPYLCSNALSGRNDNSGAIPMDKKRKNIARNR